MPIVSFYEDFAAADQILQKISLSNLRLSIADAISAERQRCYEIVMACDSGRGHERMIADAIMRRAPGGTKP